MENKNVYGGLLSKYLIPLWRQVLILALFFVVSIAIQLAIPQIIRFFIDAVMEGKGFKVLLIISAGFIGVSLLYQLMDIGVTYFSQNVGWTATNALREDLINHCLKQDLEFHKKHRSGDLIEKIDGDVNAMFNFFSNLLVEVLSFLALLGGVLILLFFENVYIGLAMTGFVAILFIIMKSLNKLAVSKHASSRREATKFYGYIGEVINNKEDVRSNGGGKRVIDQLINMKRSWLPISLKASLISISMWTSTLFMFAVGHGIAFGVGGILWSKGMITVGTVYLIFHYVEIISMPLRQVQRQLADLQKVTASAERINEILQMQPKVISGRGKGLSHGSISVEVEGVDFQYEKDHKVLEEVSFTLTGGHVLGLLGRTGSGKTTLGRLLARLYDVSKGEIRLNGQLISTIPMEDIRSKIAYVTQEIQLFNGTIRDNLTFYNPNIKDEEIWRALEIMELEGWIKSLPHKLDTVISGGGKGFSAGEAQLLAFVRIFLRNPGLIIMDEASSKLDPLTEELMERAIDKLIKGRTTIIIAHRLETVQRADKIMILENGLIKEFGDKQQLLKDQNSTFSIMMKEGLKEALA